MKRWEKVVLSAAALAFLGAPAIAAQRLAADDSGAPGEKLTAQAKSTGSCQDPTLTVTIANPPSGPGIYNDGKGNYVDGQNGVYARIQSCEGHPDAVIKLGTGSGARTVTYDFSGALVALSTFVSTPTWASSGQSFVAQGFFNFKQIADTNLCGSSGNPACYQPGSDYWFTTYMYNGAIMAPDGQAYSMHTVSSDPPSNTGGVCGSNMTCTELNSPYTTSLVSVHHIPPSGTSKETWVITPIVNCTGPACNADVYQAGAVTTLVSTTTSRQTTIDHNAGQFTMPLQFTIVKN